MLGFFIRFLFWVVPIRCQLRIEASLSMSLLFASQLFGAAFVVQPGLRAAPAIRAPSPVLSEAKGRRDWVFIKGINDYGKEQTYMTLGASQTAQSRFAFDPFGFEDNEVWSLSRCSAIGEKQRDRHLRTRHLRRPWRRSGRRLICCHSSDRACSRPRTWWASCSASRSRSPPSQSSPSPAASRFPSCSAFPRRGRRL